MDQRVRQINVAHDGTILDIPLAADASVEELQTLLASRGGVPAAEQILINEQGVNLRANQRLGSPRVEAAIFFFNIRHVTAAEAPVEPLCLPVLSEPSDAGGGTEAFLYLRRADEICDVGRTTLKEQKVMSRALGAARANLVGHTSYFTKKFQGFDDELKSTLTRYRNILEHCGQHFQHLLTVQIPEVLQEAVPALRGCANLQQTEPLQQLRAHEKYAATGLEQIEGRITELRGTFNKFRQQVDDVSSQGDEVSVGGTHFQQLDAQIEELVAMREKQYDSRKALGECGGDEARSAALAADMEAVDTGMVAIMTGTLEAKQQLRQGIHAKMQAISELQTNIRKMGKTTNGYYDSLHSLNRYFDELRHVEHIAAAFAASQDEVHRRQLFKTTYENELSSAIQRLQAMFHAETS